MLGEEDAQELLRGGAECSKEIEALLSVVDIEASSGPAKRGLSFFRVLSAWIGGIFAANPGAHC